MKTKTIYFTLTLFLFFLILAGCKKDDDKKFLKYTVPGDYSTIQAAIDASSNGDTVVVLPGTYKENIDFKGKLIMLCSTDPTDSNVVSSTIIDGNDNGTVVTITSGETSETLLLGFTITGGNAGTEDGGGIIIANSSNPVIKHNIIRNNTAKYGAGILVTNESQPIIEGNMFFENDANSRGGAIYAIKLSNVIIKDNIFTNHESADGVIHIGGANASDKAVADITGNIIKNNTTGFGTGAIKITVESIASIVNNEIINNEGASDNSGGAISVTHSSSVDILNNVITGNIGSRVGAIVIYRESNAMISGNTISENIAGEQNGNYGSGGGIAITYQSTATVINNTITNNEAWNPSRGGGGIMIDASEVIIENNLISDNMAYRRGGGIYLWVNVLATINGNTISNNAAEGSTQACGGGIYSGDNCEAKIYGNNISDNFAEWFGGGIYLHRDAVAKDEAGTNWPRINYPPTVEPHNIYSNNDHGDDTHQGAHVFFDN